MRALLIYPNTPPRLWDLKYVLEAARKKAFQPPLGLLTAAALMPKDWDLRLVDMNVEELSDDTISNADAVFLSAMIVHRDSVAAILDRCRRLNKRVVAGGPLFTTDPHLFENVDHVIMGEAELTFPSFLRDYNRDGPERFYQSEGFPDITRSPVPRWDLVDINNYLTLCIQYSRGCQFDCEFCDVVRLNGRQPRVKSEMQVISELENLHSLGWSGPVSFVDDNFISNKSKVKSLLKSVVEWQKNHNYPFRFQTQASLDLADHEQLVELMVAAGFERVCIGFETPEDASLKECGKEQNRGRDMIQAVRKMHRKGLEVGGSFIVGFDSDPPDMFERCLDFLRSSGIVTASISPLRAFPGTRLHERLQKEGRLVGQPADDPSDGSLNFISKHDPTTFRSLYEKTLERAYSEEEYYLRISEFLNHFRQSGVQNGKASITMIFGALVYLGFKDGGFTRVIFWKTLLKSLMFHRDALGNIVPDLFLGYHFRKTLGKSAGRDGKGQKDKAQADGFGHKGS